MVYDGETRATRVAKLLPGATVRVDVMRTLARPVGHLPTIGDKRHDQQRTKERVGNNFPD